MAAMTVGWWVSPKVVETVALTALPWAQRTVDRKDEIMVESMDGMMVDAKVALLDAIKVERKVEKTVAMMVA